MVVVCVVIRRLLLVFVLAVVFAAPDAARSNGSYGAAPQTVTRAAVPVLSAQSALLLDDTTGKVLYASHPDTLRYPASTLKMLTAIVTIRRLPLDRIVVVPAQAMVGGSSAYLRVGERMTVRELLYGLLLPSGNDAAITLAVAIAGSPVAFAGLLNAEARRLHLWHSHFLGATGLDSAGQYASTRDLATIGHDLLQYPLLARIVRTQTYAAISADGRYRHNWRNLDQLLWTYPGACGVKTGTTPLAGANVVACAQRGGRRLIAVLLGDTIAGRYPDASRLLDYGWQVLKEKGQTESYNRR